MDSAKIRLLLVGPLVIMASCNILLAQSLVKDGSFEEMECPDNTIGSFFETPVWKATGADAYLLSYVCPLEQNDVQGIIAINTQIVPYEGDAYVSLEGIVFNNGYYLSEGVSQELIRPTKAGKFYFLELATLKYDARNPFNELNSECLEYTDRNLELRLGNEHIAFDIDGKGNTVETLTVCDITENSNVYIDDIHDRELLNAATKWQVYWNCIQVEEEYTFIGLTGPNKQSSEPNSCMGDSLVGAQSFSGFALDGIQFYEMPEELDTVLERCTKDVVFDISKIQNSPFLRRAEVLWDNGSRALTRSFSQPGEYRVEFIFPCTTIPLNITVKQEDCDVIITTPNVFTPLNQGVNQNAIPTIKSKFPVVNYEWNIFDRWGNLVFTTSNPTDSWDGYNHINVVEEGVYMWHLSYSTTNPEIFGEEVGTITVFK